MLTYPEIDPVIFSIFGLKIRWYGMMYVVGFVAGWWLARRRSKETWAQIKPEQVDDLVRVHGAIFAPGGASSSAIQRRLTKRSKILLPNPMR